MSGRAPERGEPRPAEGVWDGARRALGFPRRPRTNSRYVARPIGRAGRDQLQRDMAAEQARYGRRAVYGAQARRSSAESVPYVLAFGLMLAALAGFVYLGVSWATGAGPSVGLGGVPTPMPLPSPSAVALPSALASPPASPQPSPVAERTYVVKQGDNPAAIAAEFGITADALLAANGITDPRTLQVGQKLKIPTPPATQRPR